MNILLLSSFSLNSGDAGILIATVEALQKTFKKSTITAEVSHPSVTRTIPELDRCILVPRIIDIQSFMVESSMWKLMLQSVIGLYDWVSFFVWSVSVAVGMECLCLIRQSRKHQATCMRDADIVISLGGGYLSTFYNYWLRLLTYIIMFILRKRIYVMAQTIGPFSSLFSKLTIPLFLRRAELITVREPDTYRYLLDNTIKGHILTADMAFLLQRTKVKKKRQIAICLKNSNNPHAEKRFESSVRDLIRVLLKRNYRVIIVCHMPTDEPMALRLQLDFPSQLEVHMFGLHPKKIMKMYGESIFVLAAHMHAIVFCSSNYVPFIGISYEKKFDGLIEQLQYDAEFLISYDRVTGKLLIDKAEELLRKRTQLISQLTKRIPIQISAANRNILLLKSNYNK